MITFQLNGQLQTAAEGQSVAAVLLTIQERVTRHTRITGKPRGIFCGIGSCFDCLLIIDGLSNQRSCVIEIKEGMVLEVQNGN